MLAGTRDSLELAGHGERAPRSKVFNAGDSDRGGILATFPFARGCTSRA
jgi:hypothetical protein